MKEKERAREKKKKRTETNHNNKAKKNQETKCTLSRKAVIARIISRSIGCKGISVDRRLVLVLFFSLPVFSVSLVFLSYISFRLGRIYIYIYKELLISVICDRTLKIKLHR